MKTIKIIEYIGIPGSGKTTHAKKYSDERGFENISLILAERQINQSEKSHFQIFVWLLNHPRNFKLYIYGCSLGWQIGITLKDKLLSTYRILVAITIYNEVLDYLRKEETSKKKVYVADEFMLHKLWSVIIGKNMPSLVLLEKFLISFYENVDLEIIYLDCPVEISARRVNERNSQLSRFDKKPQETLVKIFTQYSSLTSYLYEVSNIVSKKATRIQCDFLEGGDNRV